MGFKFNDELGSYYVVYSVILVGLLLYIGMKDQEKNEYYGVCNVCFNIFFVFGLFKKQLKWVMLVELVEIFKLWVCVVVKIELDWIELLVKYLSKCSYSELYWLKKNVVVMVYEKVMLYGILIVFKCLVNYGMIDFVFSCEIFICSVLVEGDWEIKYVFFK